MADQHTLEQYLNKKSSYAERVNLLRDADGWLNCYRGDDCKHLLTQTYIVTALKSIPLPDYTQPPSDKFLQRTLPNYLQQNPSVLQNVIRDRQQLSPSMGLRMYNAVRADPLMTAMEIVFPLILFIILYKGLKRTNFLTRFGYFSTANKSNLPVRNVSKRNLKP
jgi:hypothetical protein